MIKIPLTQNKVAFIDDQDYSLISQYKWHALKHRNNWYASSRLGNQVIRMHRVIMNAQKGQQIDHWNHNGLDNRRLNLRFATTRQQIQNSKKYKKCSSQFKGVSWNKIKEKWQAYVHIPKKMHLGWFRHEEEAAKVYNQAAIRYFGKFAFLNQVN